MIKLARAVGGLAASAFLCACGTQDSAPVDDGEPMLDIGQMRPSDTTVPKTEYHASALVDCSVGGQEIEGGCMAGVVRGWGEDGSSLIEIAKPDGLKRVIFVGPDGEPFGADSTEADGSASWEMAITRDGDRVTVQLGPERYSWPDAFVLGH